MRTSVTLRTLFALTASLLVLAMPQVFAANVPLEKLSDGSFSYTYRAGFNDTGVRVSLRMVDEASAQLLWEGYMLKDRDQLLTTEDMRWQPDWETLKTQVPLDADFTTLMRYPTFYMWDKYVVIKVSCRPAEICTMELTNIHPSVMATDQAPQAQMMPEGQPRRMALFDPSTITDCLGGHTFITSMIDWTGMVVDPCGRVMSYTGEVYGTYLPQETWRIPWPELPVMMADTSMRIVSADDMQTGTSTELTMEFAEPVTRIGERGLMVGQSIILCLKEEGFHTSVSQYAPGEGVVNIVNGSIFTVQGEVICPSPALKRLQTWVQNMNDSYFSAEAPDYATFVPLHSSMRVGYDKNGVWVYGRYAHEDALMIGALFETTPTPEEIYPLSDKRIGHIKRNDFVWPGVIAETVLGGTPDMQILTTMTDRSYAGLRLKTAAGKNVYIRDNDPAGVARLAPDMLTSLAEAVDSGILQGRKDGSGASLSMPLLRGEGMTLVYRALQKNGGDQPCDVTATLRHFKDANPNEWYGPPVCQLVQRGIVKGNPDGTLRLGEPLRAAEFLVMVLRMRGDTLEAPYPGEEWFWPVMRQALTGLGGDWQKQPGEQAPRWWAAAVVEEVM